MNHPTWRTVPCELRTSCISSSRVSGHMRLSQERNTDRSVDAWVIWEVADICWDNRGLLPHLPGRPDIDAANRRYSSLVADSLLVKPNKTEALTDTVTAVREVINRRCVGAQFVLDISRLDIYSKWKIQQIFRDKNHRKSWWFMRDQENNPSDLLLSKYNW